MHPTIVRHLLFPLQETAKRKNTSTFLAKLEKSQWLNVDDVQRLQIERLQEYLRYAYDNVLYYRRTFDAHGIVPQNITDLKQFSKVPFLTRESLRNNFGELRSSKPVPGVQKLSTGGSTGSPVSVLVDSIRNSFIDAARLRSHRWFDADMGVREVVLWGSPIEASKQDLVRNVRDRLFNSQLLSAFDLGEGQLAHYSRFIQRYRPVKMYGYSSALYLLAQYFQANKIESPDCLKVIFATAEPLFDFQREAIRQAFQTSIAMEYGARDAGLMANECPEGGLHIPAEGMVVEIDQPDSEGRGEIVVTNLFAMAMPIIRYRTGDIGSLSPQPCSCGRGLPILNCVEGRQTDFIITPDGRVMHALAVIYILRDCPEIEKFQVVQESKNEIVVFLVVRRDFTSTVADSIKSLLRQRLGESVNVRIEMIEEIATSASGKFRYVISHVAESYLRGDIS